MHDRDAQIEELISKASYTDALALLDRVYRSSPSPKQTLILALNPVSQFRSGEYDDAINTFLDLDVNPAKVVALYLDKVAVWPQAFRWTARAHPVLPPLSPIPFVCYSW